MGFSLVLSFKTQFRRITIKFATSLYPNCAPPLTHSLSPSLARWAISPFFFWSAPSRPNSKKKDKQSTLYLAQWRHTNYTEKMQKILEFAMVVTSRSSATSKPGMELVSRRRFRAPAGRTAAPWFPRNANKPLPGDASATLFVVRHHRFPLPQGYRA